MVNVLAHKLIKEDGYGRYVMHIIRALLKQRVTVRPGTHDVLSLPTLVQRLQGWDWSSNLTISAMPAWDLKPVSGQHWALTMWEDDSLPKDWAKKLNDTVERVIVPCEHNAEVFKNKGVQIPIHVVHGGTCPQEFPLLPYMPKDTYTFLAWGDRGRRKGVEIAWSAFYKAFPNEENVRLLIKARPDGAYTTIMRNSFSNNPRINWWLEDVESMQDVFTFADCVVYPAFGDGWGMMPREAVMSGLPTIVTAWSGLEVGIDHWATKPIKKYKMANSDLPSVNGKWAIPDVDEVAEAMRWCYENRAEARAKAEAGRDWLATHQTWDHTATGIKSLMEAQNAVI